MCGNANCAPFGCVVGEAIEHVGAGNIVIGLSSIFIVGIAVGYFVAVKRTNVRYVATISKTLTVDDTNASRKRR